jgi:hypothetical protein
MITLPSKFGASDHPACPNCGKLMSVVRRSPHAFSPDFEEQTLFCESCGHEMSRSVNGSGEVQNESEHPGDSL